MTPFTPANVANTTPEQLTALRAGAPETCAAWIQVAAEMGLIEAQAIYAQMLLDGIGLEQSYRRAGMVQTCGPCRSCNGHQYGGPLL
jgi:hypothetical protein